MYPVRNSSFPRSVCCHPYVRTSCPLIDVANSRMVCPDFFIFFQIFGSVYSRTTVTLIAVNSTLSSVSCTFSIRGSGIGHCPAGSLNGIVHLLARSRSITISACSFGQIDMWQSVYSRLGWSSSTIQNLSMIMCRSARVSTATLPVGPALSSSDSSRAWWPMISLSRHFALLRRLFLHSLSLRMGCCLLLLMGCCFVSCCFVTFVCCFEVIPFAATSR